MSLRGKLAIALAVSVLVFGGVLFVIFSGDSSTTDQTVEPTVERSELETDEEEFEILHWDAEKHRKALESSSR